MRTRKAIKKHISIQALYDYKERRAENILKSLGFQFKHCTIIRLPSCTYLISYHVDFNSSIVRL